MSETATILAIVVPGGVAALSIVAQLYSSRRQTRATRLLSDLDAARSTLDEAAQLFHELSYAVDDALAKYTAHGEAFFEAPENGADAYGEIERIGKEIDRMVVRLGIRLGPEHPAAKLFREANTAVLSIFRRLGRIRVKGLMVEEENRWELLQVDRTVFGHLAEQFVKAAHKAAGAELPQ